MKASVYNRGQFKTYLKYGFRLVKINSTSVLVTSVCEIKPFRLLPISGYLVKDRKGGKVHPTLAELTRHVAFC